MVENNDNDKKLKWLNSIEIILCPNLLSSCENSYQISFSSLVLNKKPCLWFGKVPAGKATTNHSIHPFLIIFLSLLIDFNYYHNYYYNYHLQINNYKYMGGWETFIYKFSKKMIIIMIMIIIIIIMFADLRCSISNDFIIPSMLFLFSLFVNI